MAHVRSGIQTDAEGRSVEPAFLLWGHYRGASHAVRMWAVLNIKLGGSKALSFEAMRQAELMDRWIEKNPAQKETEPLFVVPENATCKTCTGYKLCGLNQKNSPCKDWTDDPELETLIDDFFLFHTPDLENAFIDTEATESEYLEHFFTSIIGKLPEDFKQYLRNDFETETGKKVPAKFR